MNLSRARALALVASATLLPQCSSGRRVRIGSKNFTESFVIAEIYAQTLETAGLAVERRFNLGSTQIAMAAMKRGDIDLYPEYTGTALIDVLHLPPISDPKRVYTIVSDAFNIAYGFEWLTPSPLNDSQGLATTAAIAQRHHLRSLSDLAPVAHTLRLATIPEFVTRPDGIPGLQHRYGGFHFESVRVYDIALKYQALLQGQADIATAFTTDGAISSDHLVVLQDDRGLWPPYNVAPVASGDALKREPRIASALNRIAPAITSAAAARMNAAVEGGEDPADVAAAFLKERSRMSGAQIALRGVTVQYKGNGRDAIASIDLDIAAGECIVLVGPSGCGKSTLLRTMNRLVPLASGTIHIDGADIANADPVQLRRTIGYAIQAVGLFAHMTVAQNIAIVPTLLGWANDRIAARVDELLVTIGLDAALYCTRRPRELSGGEAQRVGVARALAARPRVLLMDEPFGAVDAIVRKRLQDEMLRIVRELGTTTLFVTHDIDEALRLADRIVVMRDGRIEQVATPLDLLAQPATAYVAELTAPGEAVAQLRERAAAQKR